jgi:hypothetical protein
MSRNALAETTIQRTVLQLSKLSKNEWADRVLGIAHFLTIVARAIGICEDTGEPSSQQRLLALNEIQHRLTASARAKLTGSPYYPDDVLLEIALEYSRNGGFEEDFLVALNGLDFVQKEWHLSIEGGVNTYAYAESRPVSNKDFDGKIVQVIGPLLIRWGPPVLAAIWAAAKTPNVGKPGSTYVNPGSGQERKYGANGRPEYDIDWDHNHDAEDGKPSGTPHGHNWGENGREGPVRISPWPEGRKPSNCP